MPAAAFGVSRAESRGPLATPACTAAALTLAATLGRVAGPGRAATGRRAESSGTGARATGAPWGPACDVTCPGLAAGRGSRAAALGPDGGTDTRGFAVGAGMERWSGLAPAIAGCPDGTGRWTTGEPARGEAGPRTGTRVASGARDVMGPRDAAGARTGVAGVTRGLGRVAGRLGIAGRAATRLGERRAGVALTVPDRAPGARTAGRDGVGLGTEPAHGRGLAGRWVWARASDDGDVDMERNVAWRSTRPIRKKWVERHRIVGVSWLAPGSTRRPRGRDPGRSAEQRRSSG